jgi:lysophospholipase L1-like esterase
MSRYSPASGGGSSSSAASATGNTIVGLGDSITYGNGTWPGTSGSFSNGDTSWFTYACYYASGKLKQVYNAGISGQTSTQILARVQTDVIAKSPKMCAILCGTNDPTNGIALATTKSNIDSMITQLQAAGITPILCTIPPQSISTNRPKGVQINLVIRYLAQKYKLHLVDFYAMLVDPATGAYLAGYSGDGIHPNAATAKLMGQAFANQMSPLLPNGNGPLAAYDGDTTNGVLGGLFTVDTNLDGVGDNWTTSGIGAATFSLVTDAAIVGKWQSMQKTVNDANSITVQSNVVATTGGSFNAGDKVLVCARIQTAGVVAGAMTFSVRLKWNGLGGGPYLLFNCSQDFDGIVCQEITIPASNTTLQIQLIANQGTGTLKIAQAGIYGLTALGL